MYMYILKLAT